MGGYGSYKEIWLSQVKALLNQGFRVINLDRRNSGRSQATTKGLRMSRQGKDVAELINFLNFRKLNLMGNSMGASVIWAYISLYGEEKINKIISVDQSPKMINEVSWPFGMKGVNWENFHQAAENIYYIHTTYKYIDNETFELLKQIKIGQHFDKKLNKPLLIDHTFQDWRDIIKNLSVPTLFVSSDHTPLWPSDHVKIQSKMAKKGAYRIISNAGHIIMAEQPEKFNQLMLKFFKQSIYNN